jgi:hypothetical protein
MIDYFKQLNMLTIGNGTVGASGTGSVSGYNLMLSHLFIMFVLFLYRLNMNTNNLYAVMILLILNNSMIFLLFIMFALFLYRFNVNTDNLYAVMILLILNNNMIFLLDFEIKIYYKMPKLLTRRV